ncbi:MAG TPA: alpha/beta hydrolase, partial [Chitinophagaceae bacterium]
ISGLGADERAFEKLNLPEDWNIKHIKWVDPLSNESLEHYSKRLSEQIDRSSTYSFIGLSFGGIIALEMAKFMHPRRIVVLSSLTTQSELPLKYKIAGKFWLHKMVPSYFYKNPTSLTNWLFGVKNNSDKRLLKMIIEDTPDYFLKWAIDRILNWSNNVRPDDVIHIHGDKDKLLPVHLTKADVIIKNAGHLMVYTHADQVSKTLTEVLNR